MLSLDSKPLLERYRGQVPCAVLDIDRPAAMLMTIRINRAKGTHVALQMSAIVHELVEQHGIAPEQVMRDIGATRDEVNLLLQDGVFTAKDIKNYKYSLAWVPEDPNVQRRH